ncbi:unnamed protein product [Fraxinus pennsylvanica]|uniref:Uncharacterized protein n=1 Tax=Fraxinus pennsylvanica TaxID=56036 RepID=A0AAD1YXB0_9LAMI|nr:unnamed protein product [Fraxinus pennsylvanica]
MLEYEWANPSTIMLSSEGTVRESNQNRQTLWIISTQLTNLYDPRVYGTASASSYTAGASMLSLEPDRPNGFMMVPKGELVVGGVEFNSSASRIGLDLGGRTYFASSEDDYL